MESNRHIMELSDFIGEIPQSDFLNYNNIVLVVPIDGTMGKNSTRNPFPLQMNACTMLFVISGEMALTIDYKEFKATENCLVFLTERHLLSSVLVSKDFKGYHIMVDNVFFKNSTHGEMPPKQGVVYYARQNPVLSFEKEVFDTLIDNVKQLSYNILRSSHRYQNNLIVNNMAVFAYEVWNKSVQEDKMESQNPHEEIALRFFDLVFDHCKEQHEVSFYAEQLCVTPVQLSRAVKNVMGKSALNIIHDIMLTEAKIQLRKQNVSIQQIADYLNFSDQAAFSKFFKKNTGVPPTAFRKSIVIVPSNTDHYVV